MAKKARNPSKSIELTERITKWLHKRRYGELKALACALFDMAIDLYDIVGEKAVFAIINKEVKFVLADKQEEQK